MKFRDKDGIVFEGIETAAAARLMGYEVVEEEQSCDTCIHDPPSSCDGKPCSVCDTSDPLLNCHQRKDANMDKSYVNDPVYEELFKDVEPWAPPGPGMATAAFERLLEEQLDRCREVLVTKAREYATDDRLHNFRVAAALQGLTPVQALAGMMAKHSVSVYDMCWDGKDHPVELWQEKITDSLNYLLLLNALVRENGGG